jgi:hypothetical protein
MSWSCGAGFPACLSQNANDGRLESLPHKSKSFSQTLRTYLNIDKSLEVLIKS